MLALYLFGPPRLDMDGTAIHIPRRKAMALLAYLAVTGQSHSRDSLATLLWPENDQSSARAELRRTLWVLNRTLGEGWLVTDRETARLKTENDPLTGNAFWLDVGAFQGQLKICEAHNHPLTVTCPECLPALEEAAELYNNNFMAGFSLKDCPAYDEWQFFQGEELRTQLTNTLVQLSSHYTNELEYETAIRCARRWLALDPLQEAAHRQLMSLFSQSGQRTAALRQYEICRQILADELGVEPSDETKNQYQQLQVSMLLSDRDLRPKDNLPIQSTPFIGREAELAEIREKLKENDCRLLTLLGPGGSGKTRLAIEAVGALLPDYQHGIFFVNLAPLQDSDQIPATIASALNFSFYGQSSPEDQLLGYLGNKEMLLILDNFEHLLEGACFVIEILNATPGVKIMATSRARLMVTGEHIFDVWGMAYPESPVSVETASDQFSAIKLFESHASRVQGGFILSDDNLGEVIRICALLEGMPLGIVLAASWVMMLTPAEISDEIAQDLEFLEKELQDLPQRQRSLRSVFNHSWRLLSEGERQILGTLSVFRGGLTREAAREVAGASLGDLMGLIDKSMLQRIAEGRFEVHELMRQFAAEKLESDPNREVDIRAKHSETYLQALAIWERDLQGPRQIEATQELMHEIDNIRAAWGWAVGKTNVKELTGAINGLCIYLYQNRQRVEGEETCQILVDRLKHVGDPDKFRSNAVEPKRLKLQARALAWGGFFHWKLGNKDRADELLQNCLSLLDMDELVEVDTRFEKAVVYLTLPLVIKDARGVETNKIAEKAVALFKTLDEPWWVGLALTFLGDHAALIEEGTLIFEESLAVRKRLGDLRGMADTLENLSRQAALKWNPEKAEALANESLEIYRALGDQHRMVAMYAGRGSGLVWQGRFHEARSMVCKTLEIFSDLGYTQSYAVWLYAGAGYPDLYLGEYQAARDHAYYAIDILTTVKHDWVVYWTATANDILGRVALGEGSYVEAEKLLQECLTVYQSIDNPRSARNASQALAILGIAARGLNQISQAKSYLCLTLRRAIEWEGYLALYHILPGIALLFADQGDIERAVELYALAATQGIVANSKWFADIAGDEIAALAEKLPVEVVEAAKARGRGLDLWDTAEGLRVDLEEMGWGSADP